MISIIPLAAIGLLWVLLSQTRTAQRLGRGVLRAIPAKAVSVGLAVAAIMILVRGNVWAALCLFGVSLWQLGRASRQTQPPDAALVRRRSSTLEMDCDPATGRLSGRVRAGPYAGTALDSLSGEQCANLRAACQQTDLEGLGLLEPYLDSRFPGWRTADNANGDSRETRARSTGRMSEDEAYEVLGLRRGASRDDIVRSHRSVMKKWHPDQGGTVALAARANEAKEVLLRSHA